MIAVINYGLGNVAAVKKMLLRLGAEVYLADSRKDILRADKLILPGVGAFDEAMRRLDELDWKDTISSLVLEEKKPVLGICLGMQLMTKGSEEGRLPGFGFIDAETVRFKFPEHSPQKVPHMGWNTVRFLQEECPLVKDLSLSKFYFVHSYHVSCNDPSDRLMSTTHGIEFTSSFRRNHIYGVQFHPEKSHKYGLRLLTNYIHQC